MGQTKLESTRSLDKWLFEKYTSLLRRFNFLSEETIVEFEHNKPSVVFYADLWPARGGDNRKLSSYVTEVNAIFTSVKPLVSDEKPPPERKATEKTIKRAGLLRKVLFAHAKLHEDTHALISSLSYNKDCLRKPFDHGTASLFPLAKDEALAEGVADLFLKQLGAPYSNAEFTPLLRKTARDGLKSELDSIANEKDQKTVMQTLSREWATLLRYRGTKELRNALRRPIYDRINRWEEIIYQKIGKRWEEDKRLSSIRILQQKTSQIL